MGIIFVPGHRISKNHFIKVATCLGALYKCGRYHAIVYIATTYSYRCMQPWVIEMEYVILFGSYESELLNFDRVDMMNCSKESR